jgi:hypothetical protein
MKTNIKIWMLVIVAAFMIQSCSKEAGVGGKKEIKGKVTYAAGVAEGAEVYISYDASESDGTYDDVTLTDAAGNYSFDGLQVGDYYIDADYTDDHGLEFNTAGYSVTIGDKKGSFDVDITLD